MRNSSPAITAPNLNFDWLRHGFGLRDSVPPADLTTVRQIHSALVLDACGRRAEQIGDADAIVSYEPGVTIGIRTADCVPILLADAQNRHIACVHAGWRGTAKNIIGETVRELLARGSRPENLYAAIGPSIGSCCYKVGHDVASQFEKWLPEAPLEADAGASGMALDLPGINETQLIEMGIRNIWKSGECTFCGPDRFFSFRREKEKAGRMLSFVSRMA